MYCNTNIVLPHLARDAITGTLHILNSVLGLIACWDVFPGAQECLLLHGSWCGGDGYVYTQYI